MDQRYERTDREIKRTFVTSIQRSGYDALTVAQLARDSLVDRSTFYAHYAGVYELATAVMMDYITVIEDTLNQSLRESRSMTMDHYQFFSTHLMTYLITNTTVLQQLRLISLGTNSFDAQCRRLFRKFYQQVFHLNEDNFTVYLFVNMAMSDLDFILERQRVPQRQELNQSLRQIERLLESINNDN